MIGNHADSNSFSLGQGSFDLSLPVQSREQVPFDGEIFSPRKD